MTNPAFQPIDETTMHAAELADIRRRRGLLGMDTSALDAADPLDRGLFGLAFSGGGIRSASFVLGVSQALARHGVLGRFDYLSTVSGGGYLGSALGSLLGTSTGATQDASPATPNASPTPRTDASSAGDGAAVVGRSFPFRLGEGTAEPDALTHLRTHSNYLTPGGSMGRLRLAGVLVRGVVLNVFLFLPWMLAGVVLTALGFEIEARLGLGSVARFITGWLILLTLAMMLTFPFVVRFARDSGSWHWRNRHESMLAGAVAASLLAVLVLPLDFLVTSVVASSWEAVRRDIVGDLGALDRPRLWAALALAIVVWLGLLGRFRWARQVTVIVSRALLLVLGPTLILGTYLLLCARFVHPPYVRAHVQQRTVPAVTDSLRAGVLPTFLRERVGERLRDEGGGLSPRATVAVLPDRSGQWIVDSVASPRSGYRWLVGPTNGPDGTGAVSRFPISSAPDSAGGMHLTVTLRRYPEPRDLLVLGLFVLMLTVNALFVDVNVTSLHGFYRDRISRAFLLRRDGAGLAFNDLQRLSGLNPSGIAPYHLVNATINVSGSTDPSARGRNADFFLFSRYWTGSRSTGYCATTAMEAADRRLDLAAATSISGAAASPRMGVATNPFASGDLALFNLRLGYWLPNPARVAMERVSHNLSGPGPGYLLRESFGILHAHGRYVNISDGGHIENLGVYELLRRRCRVIVAVDAEGDRSLDCDAVATLTRYARIDLGAIIEIDLSGIRDHTDGVSRSHWALGRVYYGPRPEDIGHLFYLKASLTGDENEYISAFRRRFPAFPQQSTADQFFDETRFETYRALGDHIASAALASGGPLEELLS